MFCAVSVLLFVHRLDVARSVPLPLPCLELRRTAFTDLVSVLRRYMGLPSIRDFQNNMGTVTCHNGVFANGLNNVKVVAQVSRMREDPDSHP